MTERMVKMMTESGEYPKRKLEAVLMKYTGIDLELAVAKVFAEWAMARRLPAERFTYGQDYVGEWQNWSAL